ncbi:hypothetical protein TRFO_42303 [Tritrichomonas foetus]|nr:hypothetical protein TRFO_42303 [Tritrichomonas foetus]|eukprot:OHT15757.1 hypothetical protein TRFO_42303 [Tritrichomonas foetus]
MENHANIETSPCDLLLTYGIQPNDLVKAGDIFGKVIGQFTCKCVIEDLISREIHFCQLNNIQLIRSYSKEPKFVNYKSFNGEIVSVLVNCSKDEKLLPFDRVLTKKGFATILGKSQDMKSYWILTDNALKLNVGCVLVNDISTFQIVRRIDAPSSDPQIDNSLLSFRESKFLPGDIVLFKNNNYVIIGKTNAQNIPNNSADNHRKDNENWEYVLQNKKDGKIFVRDGFEVIFRPDLPFQRSFQSRQNFRLLFDIDSSKFKGLRVLPGDKVRTKNGVATVIGFKANDIWIKYDDENGAGTIPQQMIFDPNLFKVIHSVGDDL